MPTYVKIAVAAVVIFALPQSAQGQTESPPPAKDVRGSLASVPILAQLATEPGLRSYVVPVDMEATIHKLFFSVAVRRHGTARFASPDTLTISLQSVPSRYTDVFGELGDVQTWAAIYDLEPLDGDLANPPAKYHIRGVPRRVSDVDHVLIQSTDAGSPIAATWYLRSGWTISATIETEFVEQHLLPKHVTADIVGHGTKIHTNLTFGNYTINATLPSPTESP